MHFSKYQALGNDYLILREPNLAPSLSPGQLAWICDRNFGIGSDGVLFWNREPTTNRFHLRIFNPDGSEAEKSGNGLRIFAKFLWDRDRVSQQKFEVETLGGTVACQVLGDGNDIRVEMGRVSFRSDEIPVEGATREVLSEVLVKNGSELTFCAATIGNPHCVVIDQPASRETAMALGPWIEAHPLFPNRTNVQILEVVDEHTIRIEIWERGAGYTLASGSSSSAAAAVALRLGHVKSPVRVVMPGGELTIEIDDSFGIVMTGPASWVFDADVSLIPELAQPEPAP